MCFSLRFILGGFRTEWLDRIYQWSKYGWTWEKTEAQQECWWPNQGWYYSNHSEILGLIFKEGVRWTILRFEFCIDTGECIDTGDYKPLFCKKPAYRPYESKIIMDQVYQLLANGWVKQCKGPLGSPIVLAVKTHQEHDTDIDNFVYMKQHTSYIRSCQCQWHALGVF